MTKPFNTEGDARLNRELATQLGDLRGGMLAVAEAVPLPPGFRTEPTRHPRVTLVHEPSRRRIDVPFHAYAAVRRAFAALFPDGMTATEGGGDRFRLRDDAGASSSTLTDSTTGLSVAVPLHALREIVEAVRTLGDGHLSPERRAVAAMAEEIGLEGATLVLAEYPSAGQPAYRIVDAEGSDLGWIRRNHASSWTVIDPDRYGTSDERIPHAECRDLEDAVRQVESHLTPPSPSLP